VEKPPGTLLNHPGQDPLEASITPQDRNPDQDHLLSRNRIPESVRERRLPRLANLIELRGHREMSPLLFLNPGRWSQRHPFLVVDPYSGIEHFDREQGVPQRRLQPREVQGLNRVFRRQVLKNLAVPMEFPGNPVGGGLGDPQGQVLRRGPGHLLESIKADEGHQDQHQEERNQDTQDAFRSQAIDGQHLLHS
jgi:hypothetical protein